MDTITEKVKELYEKYPYPYTEVKTELLNDLLLMIYYIFTESGIQHDIYSKYSFFDAGCGSGQRILGVASEFPASHFTCVDICGHSLELAKKQAQKNGIKNVTFRQANLMEFDENEKYDIVTSVGVIHHLNDPEKGLSTISRLLADEGILIVLIYHTYGEYDRMLKRRIVQILNRNGSIDNGKRIMNEIGYTLPKNQYGAYGYNSNLTENDNISKDLDVYYHPRVFTYTFETGIELFKKTAVDWVAINSVNSLSGSFFISSSQPVEPYALNPAEYLKTDYLLSIYNELPLMDKFGILESLIRPTAFSLVAGKKASLVKIGNRLKNNLVWLTH